MRFHDDDDDDDDTLNIVIFTSTKTIIAVIALLKTLFNMAHRPRVAYIACPS